MATFSDHAQAKRRVATYGKAGRKRLMDYDFSLSAQQPASSITGDGVDTTKDNQIIAENSSRLTSIKKAPSHDIYDMSSSDGETHTSAPSVKRLKPTIPQSGRTKVIADSKAVRHGPEASKKQRQKDIDSRQEQIVKNIPVKVAKDQSTPLRLPSGGAKIKPEKQVARVENASPSHAPSGSPARIKDASHSKTAKALNTPPESGYSPRISNPTVPRPKTPAKSSLEAKPVVLGGSRSSTIFSHKQQQPESFENRKSLSGKTQAGLGKPAVPSLGATNLTSPRRPIASSKNLSPHKISKLSYSDSQRSVISGTSEAETDSSRFLGKYAQPKPRAAKVYQGPFRSDETNGKEPGRPRRRLIDNLVNNSTSYGEENNGLNDDISTPEVQFDPIQSQEPKAEPIFDDGLAGSPLRGLLPDNAGAITISSQSTGPKFTYSRQRSMLAEQDFTAPIISEEATSKAAKDLQDIYEAEVEDSRAGGGIRSVHELRQAGANNRFIDEAEDILERIGQPVSPQSSSRRSSLMDLLRKMQKQEFRRQFRDHGLEQRLFLHLGRETDVIAGTLLAFLLILILPDGTTPHTIRQLRQQGITRLLIRLTEIPDSLALLSRERKNNMSKAAQKLLLQEQTSIIQSTGWENFPPEIMTPRVTALKSLEIMVRKMRDAGDDGDVISKELSIVLFQILESSLNVESSTFPRDQGAVEFRLALSVLELHSIRAMTHLDEEIWRRDFLPVVSNVLEQLLARADDESASLRFSALSLTLNVTSNNIAAARVFATKGLTAVMGQALVSKFKQFLNSEQDYDQTTTVDLLILLMNLMINVVESTPATGHFLHVRSSGLERSTIDELVHIFQDKQESITEADSVEESLQNVTFGYLAVLMGFLSLDPDTNSAIRCKFPASSLKSLVNSINEFIQVFKTVEDLEGASGGPSPRSGLTERSQRMLDQLGKVS